jgi:hypothetical protein
MIMRHGLLVLGGEELREGFRPRNGSSAGNTRTIAVRRCRLICNWTVFNVANAYALQDHILIGMRELLEVTTRKLSVESTQARLCGGERTG